MPYCFMDLRRDQTGDITISSSDDQEPGLPDGITSYLLVADCPTVTWGIFAVTLDDRMASWTPDRPVSDELAALIDSATRWPPALALARNELARAFKSSAPSQEEFAIAMATSLATWFARQPDSGFVLARAAVEEVGYLAKGEWYWALRVAKSDPASVGWVSDDYFVYTNPLSDFELTKEQIESLRKPWPV